MPSAAITTKFIVKSLTPERFSGEPTFHNQIQKEAPHRRHGNGGEAIQISPIYKASHLYKNIAIFLPHHLTEVLRQYIHTHIYISMDMDIEMR
jgi:hypothetical protein